MSQMSFSKDLLDGMDLSELRQIYDERGGVLHMLRADSVGFSRFGECYFSELLPGSVKAWKLHHHQTQNIAVPIGRIRLVIYDEREKSRTQGRVQVLEMGRPDAYFRLRIPPRLWYGFCCLSDSPALLVNCADIPHDPAESEVRPINTPLIPYQWLTQ